MSVREVAGFVEGGRRFVCRDLHLVEMGDSHLFNDTTELGIDMRGNCEAGFVQPNRSTYSQKLRAFYLRDDETGEFWSAPYEPVQKEPEEFEFNAGLGDIQWRVVYGGIECHLRLVVPRNDPMELWTVTVTNKSGRARKISVYPYFPMGMITWISQMNRYDAKLGGVGGIVFNYFPYYVKVEDYYKLKSRKNFVFCVGDRKPAGVQPNLREFLGRHGEHNPDALKEPVLTGTDSYHENAAMILQYPMAVADGESDTVNIAFGPAQDRKDVDRLVKKYVSAGGVEKALKEVERYLESIAPEVRVTTPDEELNHFVNVWLPQQTHFCGGLLRMSGDPCVRNLFQDVMGITYTMPKKARHWYTVVFAHQHRDGFMPHGAPLAPGVTMALINTIPHRDMNVWAPLALEFYLNETGDTTILKEKVGFKDSKDKKSVHEHVCLGLDHQLGDRTKRRLCRIGEGDWDDPLNMAGHKNKGESIWLTEALALALDTWAPFCELMGDKKRAARYRREAEVCRKAVNKLAWDGKWYARGTTDAGKWFGTKKDKEGKIFLNAQSWAMMCGAADTEKRVQECIDAVEEHLMTASGPMTMAPGFTSMREDIGKITQKAAGSSENGSVYCHAATFYAYSLFRVRRADEGFEVLRRLLTGGESNTLERSQQFPLYIPNFYRGSQCGRTAGRGSGYWTTGTAAWYYKTVVSEMLGLKGELKGLRIDPQLPSEWTEASVWRKFRGAEFEVTIRRVAGAKGTRVTMDGELMEGNFIPLQKVGSKHRVEVVVG